MTSFDKKIISNLATKMGVYSDSAIRKAEEFTRLLQLRMSGANSIRQLSDPCRVLLCLNLACNRLDIPFDKSDLTRLAGVSKKQYSNSLHLVEKLLNLSSPVSVNSLCVQLGISEVATYAQKVLNKYAELYSQSGNSKRPLDLSFPMYHCAAVFLACKHNKVRVNKAALIDAARVKRSQFDELLKDFALAIDTVNSSETRKVATKRSHKLIEMIDKCMEESTRKNEISSPVKKSVIEENEDYESWEKRILNETCEGS